MRRKVLCLPKWYPNKLDPLDGIFVMEHLKAISIYNDVAVIYVHSDYCLKEKRSISITEENGFFEIIIYFKAYKTKIVALQKIINAIRYFNNQLIGFKYLKKHWGTPSLTHVHVLSRTAFLSILLKFWNKIPYVITEHSTWYIQENKKLSFNYLIKKILLKNADGVTAVSSYLLNSISKMATVKNPKVISNCVDTDIFKPLNNTKLIKFQFIHISGMTSEIKNFDGILRVLKKLKAENLEFKFLAIGKGDEVNKQMNYAEQLGLTSQTIEFLGYKKSLEVAYYIQSSNAMVHFSNIETQGCVLLEAISCGIPCIASDIPAINEVINYSNGVLIERKNEELLFTMMKDFILGKYQFQKKEIQKDSIKYSYSNVGAEFDKFYKTLK